MDTAAENDTIAAIATAPGMGAIAIVRISGKNALSIVQKITDKVLSAFASNILKKITIIDGDHLVDTAMIAILRSPKTYTGEDLIEIHCHGGSIIAPKILELLIQKGARLAHPGEFTYRAFINGKMDLSQAEAVQNVISAQSELALKAAQKHLQGDLFTLIKSWQKELTDIYAFIEAWINFPEEEIPKDNPIQKRLGKIVRDIRKLLKNYLDEKILSTGIDIAIVGTPNVGKSSLLNAFVKKQKAIVTSKPGTTRDLLEEHIKIGSLHFSLTDTAGIRTTDEIIEQEGIKRAEKKREEADLILLILDAQKGLEKDDKELLQKCPKATTLICWNKTDLVSPPVSLDRKNIVKISAIKNLGIDTLKEKILDLTEINHISSEEVIISNLRHKIALEKALDALEKTLQGIDKKYSPEFIAQDLRTCLEELATIIGTNVHEDLLDAIFNNFCLGK